MGTNGNDAISPIQPSNKMALTIGWTNTMKMIRCKEMFGEFNIDPVIAKRKVPPDYEIRIHPNGKAMLLLMVQDCESCILNNIIRISPMRMAHIWIEIVGPEEIGPYLPDTTASLPTRYYYALPHQIDNALARFALGIAGIDVQKAKRISLGGNPGGIRHGMVVEQDEPTSRYSWEEKSTLWQSPNVLTGRRWFYRQYGHIIKRRSEGLVVCNSSFLGEGEVRLDVDSGSAIGDLGFGTTLYGVMNSVEMKYCNVRIRVVIR